MKARTLDALSRALDRAGLTEAARLPDCYVNLIALDHAAATQSRLHIRWGCEATRRIDRPVEHRRSLADLLTSDEVCPACKAQISTVGAASSDLRHVLTLLAADEVARSAARFAADPTKSRAAGKATSLHRKIADQLQQVDRVSTTVIQPELKAACARIAENLRAAADAVARAEQDPEQRAKVSARVLTELVPGRLRALVRLEDSPVLAGVITHHSTGKKVQEVIDTFAVARPGNNVLLLCPRYVVDYLNRYYAAGGGWGSAAIVTASVEGLTDVQVRTAASLWEPQGKGPLADLRTAVEAALMVLDEAVAPA